MSSVGLYIHVPFCRKKCDYCSFFSVPVDPASGDGSDLVDAYCARLMAEIDDKLGSLDRGSIDSVYLGGGTPSILSAGQVSSLLERVFSPSYAASDVEVTIEVNPDDVSPEKLSAFRDAGINRIVLGVQTLSGAHHTLLGRSGRLCDPGILDTFFGIDGIIHSLDLITGIPGQKEALFLQEVDHIVSYLPKHISGYILSIDEKTPLYERLARLRAYEFKERGESVPWSSGDPRPLDELQRDIFRETMTRLKSRGYLHYEVSNYCLPGFESRHNMKYWKFMPYIGIGPGAHSFFNNERYSNNMSVQDYIRSKDVVYTYDERGENAALVEFILTGIRLLAGFSIQELEQRLKTVIPTPVTERIDRLVKGGYLFMETGPSETIIRLTDLGLIFADSVIYDIVEPELCV